MLSVCFVLTCANICGTVTVGEDGSYIIIDEFRIVSYDKECLKSLL